MRMGQLWAKMGIDKTTNAKLQIKGQLWAKHDESQPWVEMSLGFKQYYKGWALVLNNTTKAKIQIICNIPEFIP